MPTSRLNQVIEKLVAGEVIVSSPPVPNGNVDIAQEYGDSDFDMVVFEMEHFGFDFMALRTSLQSMLSRRRIADDGLRPSVVPMTRIPPNARETSQWIIKQALDIGVFGFFAPHVQTAEHALAIVNAARYPERRGTGLGGGERGYWPPVAARYWGISQQEYVDRADVWPANPDGELLIVGLIESQLGVDNLERILDATSGLGAIWPGPGDMASSLGLVGQVQHPEVEANLRRVREICMERDVPCVAVATSAEDAERRVDEGFRIILTRSAPGIAATIRDRAIGSPG